MTGRNAGVRYWRESLFESATWDDLRQAGQRAAAGVRQAGVEPNSFVPCVLTNSFAVAAGVLGVWLAGGIVVSLPTIARGVSIATYRRQLGELCANHHADLLLIEERFLPFLDEGDELSARLVSYESLPGSRTIDPCPPAENDVAFIQYSSGSTREPKGCAITTRAIAEQLQTLRAALGIDPDRDKGAMWLPLSHDMGFFGGLLLCWTARIPGLLSTPERFLTAPRTWLNDCAEFDATITAAPNFALDVAIRAARAAPPSKAIPLRACVLGGERVEGTTLEEANTVLGPYGLTLEAITPAYGLAEATLAVTAGTPGEAPAVIELDSRALLAGELREPTLGSPTTSVVSTGGPLAGAHVRIAGDDEFGEISVRSPSLAEGYFGDEEATTRQFVDGELFTGDLGFVIDGELYVFGRSDDMLAVGGRNVYARDVESAMLEQAPIRRGSCAVVDVPADKHTRLVVLAEPLEPEGDFKQLAASLGSVAASTARLRIDECLFLPRGALPKTPSGKVQRFRCRQIALGGEDDVLARIRMGHRI